jgi:hypothetical protein
LGDGFHWVDGSNWTLTLGGLPVKYTMVSNTELFVVSSHSSSEYTDDCAVVITISDGTTIASNPMTPTNI